MLLIRNLRNAHLSLQNKLFSLSVLLIPVITLNILVIMAPIVQKHSRVDFKINKFSLKEISGAR